MRCEDNTAFKHWGVLWLLQRVSWVGVLCAEHQEGQRESPCLPLTTAQGSPASSRIIGPRSPGGGGIGQSICVQGRATGLPLCSPRLVSPPPGALFLGSPGVSVPRVEGRREVVSFSLRRGWCSRGCILHRAHGPGVAGDGLQASCVQSLGSAPQASLQLREQAFKIQAQFWLQ